MKGLSVAAARVASARYNETPPYHPAGNIPECTFAERSAENPAYDAVRGALIALGWDAANVGTPKWNPLGQLVRPGDVVLLKPNFVKHFHPRDANGLVYTVTHGSMIRAVADYVAIALAGSGRIIVGDAPQTDSSFTRIVEWASLKAVAEFYATRGVDFSICDLRAEEWRSEGDVIVERMKLAGDPWGYSVVDLGVNSEFYGFQGEGRYYGADYDTEVVNRNHREAVQRYCMSNTALDCDVFINLPKLKTHKKGGITCSLKNLVGINGDKNYLPHHTIGSPADGGDQFPQPKAATSVEHGMAAGLRRLSLKVPAVGNPLFKVARKVGKRLFDKRGRAIRSGNWYGNNTVWRMTLDMNRILLYWNSERRALDPAKPPKRYLSIVDAIVAGDGNGPMDPDPKPIGVVIAGTNPAAVDATAAVLMGFDPDTMPTIRQAFQPHALPIAEGTWETVAVRSNVEAWSRALGEIDPASTESFKPHFGWIGRIERRRDQVPASV